MRKIIAIIVQDLRVFLAERSNLPGLLLTPVVMTVIIGLVNGGAFGGASTTVRLDVIDQDASVYSSQLLEALSAADPALTLCPLENTEEEPCRMGADGTLAVDRGLDRVAEGVSIGLLEIPAGFGEAVAAREETTVRLHTITDFGAGQAAQRALEAALQEINGAASAAEIGLDSLTQMGVESAEKNAAETGNDLYTEALAAWGDKPLRVQMELSGGDENPSLAGSLQQGLGHSVPGMGSMFVMMTVFGGMAVLIEERRQWTLQRLAVLPVSRPALITGKVLARFTLGLLQFLVVFAVGAAFGMNFGKDPFALVVVSIGFSLAATALSFAIGTRLKNPSQAASLTLLLTLVLAPLGGAWWPIEISPRFMQVAGQVSPIYWAMDAFTQLTYEGAVLQDIMIPVAVLLGMTVVAFLIAIPRFRYDVD